MLPWKCGSGQWRPESDSISFIPYFSTVRVDRAIGGLLRRTGSDLASKLPSEDDGCLNQNSDQMLVVSHGMIITPILSELVHILHKSWYVYGHSGIWGRIDIFDPL